MRDIATLDCFLLELLTRIFFNYVREPDQHWDGYCQTNLSSKICNMIYICCYLLSLTWKTNLVCRRVNCVYIWCVQCSEIIKTCFWIDAMYKAGQSQESVYWGGWCWKNEYGRYETKQFAFNIAYAEEKNYDALEYNKYIENFSVSVKWMLRE